MHLPPVLWARICAPATHFLGAWILTTLAFSTYPAALSALPQHMPSPFAVVVLSSQYLFQRGPIWISWNEQQHILRCTNLKAFMEDIDSCINGFSLFLAVLIYLTSYQMQYDQGIIIHGKPCNIEFINQLLNVFDVNTVLYFSKLCS